jgi:hypothetical protein
MLEFLKREADSLPEERSSQHPTDAKQRALEQMCRVILNLNEFVYPD